MPKNRFLSRWWPSEHPADEGVLPGGLDGSVDDDDCDVYEHEYPLITAAHQKGFSEMANLADNSPMTSSLSNWDTKLRVKLTAAVRAEKRRGKVHSKNVH
jgi:hypothetical protein